MTSKRRITTGAAMSTPSRAKESKTPIELEANWRCDLKLHVCNPTSNALGPRIFSTREECLEKCSILNLVPGDILRRAMSPYISVPDTLSLARTKTSFRELSDRDFLKELKKLAEFWKNITSHSKGTKVVAPLDLTTLTGFSLFWIVELWDRLFPTSTLQIKFSENIRHQVDKLLSKQLRDPVIVAKLIDSDSKNASLIEEILHLYARSYLPKGSGITKGELLNWVSLENQVREIIENTKIKPENSMNLLRWYAVWGMLATFLEEFIHISPEYLNNPEERIRNLYIDQFLGPILKFYFTYFLMKAKVYVADRFWFDLASIDNKLYDLLTQIQIPSVLDKVIQIWVDSMYASLNQNDMYLNVDDPKTRQLLTKDEIENVRESEHIGIMNEEEYERNEVYKSNYLKWAVATDKTLAAIKSRTVLPQEEKKGI